MHGQVSLDDHAITEQGGQFDIRVQRDSDGEIQRKC